MSIAKKNIIRQVAVETLEQRQMYAGISFDSGTLAITGLANSSNAIKVQFKNDRVQAIVNGQATSRSLQGLHAIKIVGGQANDCIAVDSSISIPTTIQGLGGDDYIVGGSGSDVIEAGDGNDLVYGGRGNDSISGGRGDDRIYGGRGNDVINGNAGRDMLVGDRENDHFDAVETVDRVIGGDGRDTVTLATARPTTARSNDGGNRASAGVSTLAAKKTVPHVERLTLVDADTGQPVNGFRSINTGNVLDLSKLPQRLNIAAQLSQGQASVRFDLDGKKAYRIENISPYALAGDTGGRFKALNLSEGQHTLKAHTLDSGGRVMASNGVTFTVINSSAVNPRTNSGRPAYTEPSEGSPVPTPQPSSPVSNTPTTTPPQAPQTPTIPRTVPATTPTLPPTTNPTNATAQQARIAAISTTVPAGTSIHVDALRSQLGSGDWHQATYAWDFGDRGSNYNALKGFNAAHTYDAAGTYQIKLNVTNAAGVTSSTAINVTVTPAQRQVIYVSTSGSDSNAGSSMSAPIKSFAKAMTLLNDNTEILFRRGETFTLVAGANINQQNVLIGAYGVGARPVIKWAGARNNSKIFNFQSETKNVTVQDLTVDSIFDKDSNDSGVPIGFAPLGENITIRRNQLLNLMYGVNMNKNPSGVLIQENIAPSVTGIRKYFVWTQGNHVVIAGNQCANSTREHIVRINGVDRLLVIDNDFANISRREEGDYWDYRKTAINCQSGKFAYIADNKVDGALQVGPLGKADGIDHAYLRFQYAVAEGNEVIEDTVEINHGAEHVMLRDNVVRRTGVTAYQIDGFDGKYGRGCVDVILQNNTAYNTSTMGSFLKVYGSVDGIQLVDNLYVAPNLTIGAYSSAAVWVKENDLGSFTKIDGNVWPVSNNVKLWIGEQAINFIGRDETAGGYQTPAEWNNLRGVGTDYVGNYTTGSRTYVNISGHTAGARLSSGAGLAA